jgi:hypothetical protein
VVGRERELCPKRWGATSLIIVMIWEDARRKKLGALRCMTISGRRDTLELIEEW